MEPRGRVVSRDPTALYSNESMYPVYVIHNYRFEYNNFTYALGNVNICEVTDDNYLINDK